jgi:tRNA-Thr(GGU) m(6)t(6)A37 methyltransferase TsaA
MATYSLTPIGHIESVLTDRRAAPRQGGEGAPDAWVAIEARWAAAAEDLAVDDEVVLITFLHLGDREVLKVRPRNDPRAPITGVFATRSPDRPNPIGLHRVTILEIQGLRLRVAPLEAIDGTPVIDIKPVLDASLDA